MTRPKFIALLTGILSIAFGLLYLLVVLFLDGRGEMVPAPVGAIPSPYAAPTIAVPQVAPAIAPHPRALPAIAQRLQRRIAPAVPPLPLP